MNSDRSLFLSAPQDPSINVVQGTTPNIRVNEGGLGPGPICILSSDQCCSVPDIKKYFQTASHHSKCKIVVGIFKQTEMWFRFVLAMTDRFSEMLKFSETWLTSFHCNIDPVPQTLYSQPI